METTTNLQNRIMTPNLNKMRAKLEKLLKYFTKYSKKKSTNRLLEDIATMFTMFRYFKVQISKLIN